MAKTLVNLIIIGALILFAIILWIIVCRLQLFRKIAVISRYYFWRAYQLGAWNGLVRAVAALQHFCRKIKDRLSFLFKRREERGSKILVGSFLATAREFDFFLQQRQPFKSVEIIPKELASSVLFENGRAVKILLLNKLLDIPEDDFAFWHTDWTVRPAKSGRWYPAGQIPFFADIKLSLSGGKGLGLFSFAREIKIPWEVGRMQYLAALALTIGLLPDLEKEVRVAFIVGRLRSFLDYCPYLGGGCWANPMEVGIRAVNIIFILTFLDRESVAADAVAALLPELLASLQKHEKFISHYLETSVTPNNHYLADLVALLYLKVFLRQCSPAELAQFIKFVWGEFLKQLLSDGCFYEGSSAYHRLNLEMVAHVCLLDQFAGAQQTSAAFLEDSVARLFEACSGESFYLNIGDNDSGRFVFGCQSIPQPLAVEQKLQVYQFPHFGQVVIKGFGNLLSLRCYNFDASWQPSGHFHFDQLSLTLQIAGEEILVDGGTGAYTSNRQLRNFLRSELGHSTFFVSQSLEQELFKANLPKTFKNRITVSETENATHQKIVLEAVSFELMRELLMQKRRIVSLLFDKRLLAIQRVEIVDVIKPVGVGTIWSQPLSVNWNWSFAPQIKISQRGQKEYLISSNNRSYSISSSLSLKMYSGAFSADYLQAVETVNLRGALCLPQNGSGHFTKTIFWGKRSCE